MNVLLSILSLLNVLALSAQIQWADKVISVSGEFSAKSGSATQALYKPNVFPNTEINGCSWTLKQDAKSAFIRLGFKDPINIRTVIIAINRGGNTISKITLFDKDGLPHVVDKQGIYPISYEPKVAHLSIPATPYKVSSVQLDFFFSEKNQVCHLDALGISEEETTFTPTILLAEALVNKKIIPINLDKPVNTSCDEAYPVLSTDGNTLYFTRFNCESNVEGKKENSGDIYVAHLKEGKWTRPRALSGHINNNGNNIVANISVDGNTMLVYGTYSPDFSFKNEGISISQKTEEGWSYPKSVVIENFSVLSDKCNFFLTSSGKVMLMSLEKETSLGGTDLYVSFKKGTNLWSEPKNIGSIINTAAFETSPYLAADGTTLYFASQGFPGYGHMDMFISKRLDDTWLNWSEPKNMGPQINSSTFDAYYQISSDGSKAYFISTKTPKGRGQDIFMIDLTDSLKPEPIVLVKGKAYDIDKGIPIQTEVSYIDLVSGEEIGQAITNVETGEYQIALPYGKKYSYFAHTKGYLAIEENLDLSEVDTFKVINQNLFLSPLKAGQVLILNNVFFQMGKAILLGESYHELDKLVQILTENVDIKIELGGHTDNVGDPVSLQFLSDMRVAEVKSYLIKKGIDGARITGQGYGGRRPISENDSPEGRKKNRRVEFMIR